MEFRTSSCIIYFSVIFFYLLNSTVAKAQTEWRNWNSVNVNASITRKLDISASHLRSYVLTNSFNNNFNQTTLQADYDLTKRISLRGAALLTTFPGQTNSTIRFITRVSYNKRIFKKINWTSGLQLEYHSNNETRYRSRAILVTRFATRKRITPLRLSPSLSYLLFYNVGGDSIRYYDPAGNVIARNTPNGFHRGRLFINVNSKISNHLSLSVYYMRQSEFNLFTPPTRKMNVINPNNGRIIRPFDDYNVAGITLQYNFRTYKKKKKDNDHKVRPLED
jgi:hypothetical protein